MRWNNLTVFDMVTVKGLGAKEMLRVGGKLPGPGASLRFNFPQSTLMECRNGLKNNKPPYVIQKSFKVENAGELPLKVMSMNINGYKCQGFGFEVLECHSFQMDYNSSREISIAFTPDFTSSWVIRDLTFVTGRGSLFSFTLNVTLPHHMLPLCAQVVPGPSWEENFWVVTIIFIWITGSCKTFVDSCSTSDKGKGKGSPAVANGPNRNQNGSKKNSGAPAQPHKKHKVSVYYSKYKVNPIATVATAAEEEYLPMKEMDSLGDYMDQDPTTCNNNTDKDAALPEKSAQCIKGPSQSAEDEGEVAACLVPMETHSNHNENLKESISSRPDLCACSSEEKLLNNQVTRIQQCSTFLPFMEKKTCEKVDTSTTEGDLIFEASAECNTRCLQGMPDTASPQWQKSLLLDSSTWKIDIGLATELCDMRQNRKDLKTCSWPRLPMETGVTMDFGATLVNDSKMKHFTLKNPSASPITVQLLPLSLYPDPLGALDLLTKCFPWNVNSQCATTYPYCEQSSYCPVLDGKFFLRERESILKIFLIRNNLTVFDMVTVKGLGAREMLRVGGKLPGPGASLRFNFPQSTLMECRNGLKNNKPPYVIQKSFKVENAGELPLQVMSMNINGYKCQGFGFEVLECHSFQMDYNSSREISIAFTPDFTSSWVIRDLTFVTGRGSLFSFTLNVTLPHHMLPLCAQVVPGPSWEENFWVVTIIFICLSLCGVCWMACRQARYILTEFSQDNSPVDTVRSSSARITGSCKTFVDSCSTSDKGKGKGSPAVANGPNRSQNGSKRNSGAPAQPHKKHKVSVYYSKYKVNPIATVATAAEEEYLPMKEMDSLGDYTDQDPTTCNNNTDKDAALPEKSAQCIKGPSQSAEDEGEVAACLVPMETHSNHNENLKESISSRPDLCACSSEEKLLNNQVTRIQQCSTFLPFMEKKTCEKVDTSTTELRKNTHLKKKPQERVDFNTTAANGKARRNSGKNRRKVADVVVGVPEHSVAVSTEKNRDLERKEPRNLNRSRNRYLNGKQETVKSCRNLDSHPKQLQSAVCLVNPRQKCQDRRLFPDSSSDSGSSSGSVRASRGSWGSWSSLEGEKDHNSTKLHCTTSTAKSKLLSMSLSLSCLLEKTQMPETVPAKNFTPSFAAVAAGVERNPGISSPYPTEEMWSAPSVPLTTDFRYNPPESLPYIPQGTIYNGFPWNVNSQCATTYPYCEQSSYCPVLDGNANFQNAFPGQETQSLPYTTQPCWNEEETQGITSAWESTGCVGSKPYFSGTRSLSPMSSLFGSIWTPKSDPYQSQFQHDRSLSHSPQSSVSKEQAVICRQKQFSSFDPFRCHMNLDIWNSSSSRSTNSQLSNDSGYCGDV
ncbi:UNVERIFIED_CONTAM: hypothetical protein FKN15_020119 [Acipenser sinensis]